GAPSPMLPPPPSSTWAAARPRRLRPGSCIIAWRRIRPWRLPRRSAARRRRWPAAASPTCRRASPRAMRVSRASSASGGSSRKALRLRSRASRRCLARWGKERSAPSAQRGDDELEEGPHLGGYVPPRWIKRLDGELARRPVAEDGAQTAIGEVVLHIDPRHEAKAEARAERIADGEARTDPVAARNRYPQRAVAAPEGPLVGPGGEGEQDAAVGAEVFRFL